MGIPMPLLASLAVMHLVSTLSNTRRNVSVS
jgi:hypothetical protein